LASASGKQQALTPDVRERRSTWGRPRKDVSRCESSRSTQGEEGKESITAQRRTLVKKSQTIESSLDRCGTAFIKRSASWEKREERERENLVECSGGEKVPAKTNLGIILLWTGHG